MPTSPQVSAEARALTKERLARRIRRWTLVVAVLVGIWFWLGYGGRWVPAGMDTVPEIPPGSFCIVDKWARSVQEGSHVFVELRDGRVLLSRVSARDGDRITIEHPNKSSVFPDSRTLGAIPLTTVQALVLGAFTPDAKEPGGR